MFPQILVSDVIYNNLFTAFSSCFCLANVAIHENIPFKNMGTVSMKAENPAKSANRVQGSLINCFYWKLVLLLLCPILSHVSPQPKHTCGPLLANQKSPTGYDCVITHMVEWFVSLSALTWKSTSPVLHYHLISIPTIHVLFSSLLHTVQVQLHNPNVLIRDSNWCGDWG